jgi:plastocyanin
MLVLGALGLIVVVLPMLAAACGSASPTSPTNPSGPSGIVTIFIAGNRGSQSYSPNPLTVKVGQTVNWKNNDTITHTATLEGSFNTGNIPPMSARDTPVTMNAAGTFTYHCLIHPGMAGTVIVQR